MTTGKSPMTASAEVLSVSDCVVRLLDSVTCRWNSEDPNGSSGHDPVVA